MDQENPKRVTDNSFDNFPSVLVRLGILEKEVSFTNRLIDTLERAISKTNDLIGSVEKLIDHQDKRLIFLENAQTQTEVKLNKTTKSVDIINRGIWIGIGMFIIISFVYDVTGLKDKIGKWFNTTQKVEFVIDKLDSAML
jgi:hypothetical protein